MDVVWTFLQILATLTWAAPHPKSDALVFQSRAEMEKVWVADGGKAEELPKVDFDANTVIAVFGGKKPTGGHSVKIEKICSPSGLAEPWVYVLYREVAPAKGAMVTQAESYPCQVVTIKKSLGNFKFMDVGTASGQQFLAQVEAAEKRQKDAGKK